MKPEQIHDALNFLDDRLIEETEELRRKKHPSPWKKWTALAACLCLVAAGTIAVFAMRGTSQMKSDGIPVDHMEGYEETLPETAEKIDEEAAPECAEELQVRILSWKKDGFLGEVISGKENGLKPGTKIEVRLTHSGNLPEKFPEGSLVIPGLIEPETNRPEAEAEKLPVLYAENLLPCD